MQRLTSIRGALLQACSRSYNAPVFECTTADTANLSACTTLVSDTAFKHSQLLYQADLEPGYSLLYLQHAHAAARHTSAIHCQQHTAGLQCQPAFTQRSFATRATQDTAGPSARLLSAVPFVVSRQEADAAFEAYHSTDRNILLSRPAAGLQKVKELYLPLWVCRAQVQSVLRGAEIGFRRVVTRYNPATRRRESGYETQWHYVRPNFEIAQYFSPEMLEMQIVASYHYPAADIRLVRPGPLVSAAKAFDRHMMTSPADGSTRRMSAFDMKAQTGQLKAVGAIKAHQYKVAEDLLLKAYRCDETHALNLDVQLQQFTAAPVYVPVYLYSSRHVGNAKVRTFVSGIDASQVSGVRVYDEAKIGIAAAAVAASVVAFTGAWHVYPALQLFGFAVAAPALTVGFATKYWPYVYNQFQQVRRDADQYMNRKTDETGTFSTPWTHTYSQFEQFRRSQEQSRSQGQSSSRSYGRGSRSSVDPIGYYKLLEVEPSASKADIQAAFRGLAMKQHPDRFEDPQQKQAATVKFRHILDAYSVLRDNNKRQQYDAGQL